MAKNKPKEETSESLLSEVRMHYDEAKSELDMRVTHDQQGFDQYDYLYRSTIQSGKWPFNSKIFIPLTFGSIFGKGTRLVTGKIKGRLVPTSSGNELAARIGTELLSAQYDDHDFHFEEPLVSRWLKMDQAARKYGAGFGLVGWRREVNKAGEVIFDGPTFEFLDNRRVYLQPGTISVSDSDYVTVERLKTLDELERVNDVGNAKDGKPVFENLDKLRKASETIHKDEYESVNKTIRGLTEYSSGKGRFKKFRILTEYRDDQWITWCPDVGDEKEGCLLRVTDNPYKHGRKPIIRLVYIPIDDDIYGASELEPVRSEQKAVNALASGFIESVSTELYPILKGHPTDVDWKTVEFKPRAAWIMNRPDALMPLETSGNFISSFTSAFQLLKQSFSEALDETSAAGSQLNALGAEDKTATEIKDLALQRGSRDNLNKLFLSSAITKMYQMWWSMDQQFMTDKKVVRVVGKDALQYFIDQGLSGYTMSEEGYKRVLQHSEEYNIDYGVAYEELRQSGELEQYSIPMMEGEKGLPKLQLESDGKSGFLSVDSKDLTGQYRFSVDLNTMGMPNVTQEAQTMEKYLGMGMQMQEMFMQEGYKLKAKEMFETMGEKLQIHNVDMFFEKVEQPQVDPNAAMAGGGLQPQDMMGAMNGQPNGAGVQPPNQTVPPVGGMA